MIRFFKIKRICEKHGALLIEDAAEALGASIAGKPCGSFGDYSAVSFNGNKIITGSAGGCLLCNDATEAAKARKWATQSRERAAWYQHEEVGYNYRMSNVVAGIVRGQYNYLEEHVSRKKAIYESYKEGLKGLPVSLMPIVEGTVPNYWLSAMIIDKAAMCRQLRGELDVQYVPEAGKSCPAEVLDAMAGINAEGRPICKPMHLQPMYQRHDFIGRAGSLRLPIHSSAACECRDIGADIFQRGLCLPSDIKMTQKRQTRIIDVIRACFE